MFPFKRTQQKLTQTVLCVHSRPQLVYDPSVCVQPWGPGAVEFASSISGPGPGAEPGGEEGLGSQVLRMQRDVQSAGAPSVLCAGFVGGEMPPSSMNGIICSQF